MRTGAVTSTKRNTKREVKKLSVLDITDVKVVPIRGEGATRAMASVTFGEAFTVHGLRVVEGENGLFVAMPQRRDAQGNYRDVAHPITAEMRGVLSSFVLEEYQRVMERGEKPREVNSRGR